MIFGMMNLSSNTANGHVGYWQYEFPDDGINRDPAGY
jgi:hypothetical protein